MLSVQMLGQRVDERQRMDGIVSRLVHTLSRPPGTGNVQRNDTGGAVVEITRGEAPRDRIRTENKISGKGFSEPGLTQSVEQHDEGPLSFTTGNAPEHSDERRDTNLSDDMLKLIRYKILFVKRDYEVAFPEKEELISDNLSETVFVSWKIAEFMQNLEQTQIPPGWKEKDYPPQEVSRGAEGMIHSLPEEDKKYLQVFYEVLARYKRAGAGYQKRQLKALKGIRNSIRSAAR